MGSKLVHCAYCSNIVAAHADVCPFCGRKHVAAVRIKKRIMKNREISPKAYVLFVAIIAAVTAIGTFMVFNSIDSGNATGAFILVCVVAVLIAFLIYIIGPRAREYSYFS
jgi:hypothetical protein